MAAFDIRVSDKNVTTAGEGMVAEVAECPTPLLVPAFTASSFEGWEMTLIQFSHQQNPPLWGIIYKYYSIQSSFCSPARSP